VADDVMTDDEMRAAGYTQPEAPQQSSDVMTDAEMEAAGYTRPAEPQQSSNVMTDAEMEAAGFSNIGQVIYLIYVQRIHVR